VNCEPNVRGRDAASVILAGLAASVIGASFYNLLPLYLGAAQDFRGLSTREIGLIGTIYFTGFTLTTAVGFFWIRRFNWKLTALAASAVAAAGIAVGALTDSYTSLLVGAFVAGGALSMVYGIGTTALGDTTRPARWYGVKIASEAMFGAVMLFFLPAAVVVVWGFAGLVWALVIAILVLAPFLLMLPFGGGLTAGDETPLTDRATTNKPAVWSALLGCLLFMCGQTVMWSFMERLGNQSGFDSAAVGRLLAITLVFALSGSFIAAAVGERFGALRPLVAAHICYFVATAALLQADLFTVYAVGCCLVMFSVGLGLPLAVTTVAELDHDGRFVVLTVPAIGVGMLIAPGAAGWLASGRGYVPVILFGMLTLGASLAAFVAAWRLEGRPPEPIADEALSTAPTSDQ
jgi:predicted MFS family arabinose efflux permease